MSGAKDTETDGQTDRQRQTIKTLTGTDKQTDKQTYHERPIRGCRFHSSGDRLCQGRRTQRQTDRQKGRERPSKHSKGRTHRLTNRPTMSDPSVVAGFTVAETGLARGEALARTALLSTAYRLEHESRAY